MTVSCCGVPANCGGDPMLRVCEGTQACGSQGSLGFVDDACDLCPQLEFKCSESGVFSVLTASYSSHLPFICELKSPS
jgi:hypothetical protein